MSLESFLRPSINEYEHHFLGTKDLEGIRSFYHENSVLINLDEKKAVLGKEAIGKEISSFLPEGKTSQNMIEEKFSGSEEMIRYKGKCDFTTEQEGTHRFSFEQIWMKEGNKYVIYYDAFGIIDA